MATLVETTVDGGATGDYLNHFAAEADNYGASSNNLVTADEYCQLSLICTNGNADTTAVAPGTFTTDATRNITLTVPAAYRHDGTYPVSGNIYRAETTGYAIYMTAAKYMVLDGLAVKMTVAANNTWAVLGLFTFSAYNCIVQLANPNTAYTNMAGIGLYDPTAGGQEFRCKNCITLDFRNLAKTAGRGIFGSYAAASTSNKNYWYNCTAVNSWIGFGELYGATDCENCIAHDCVLPYNDPAGFVTPSKNCIAPAVDANIAWGVTRTTGTTTGAAASKLIDTNKNFTTLGVRVGSVIKNTTDTTFAYVTAVDSTTRLSISANIMASGENYAIYYNLVGATAFVDAGNDDYHLVADVANIAYRTGADLDANANMPVTTDIDGQPRHTTTPCIGADEAWPAPTVVSVTPDSGSESGGTEVTIAGTDFLSGAVVTFGGEVATGVTVNSYAELVGTTPVHAAGAVTVRVTNSDAQYGELETGYTYEADEPDPGLPGGADDPSRKKDENDPVSIWALQGPFKHRQDDFALPIKAPDPMEPLLRRRS